MAARFAYLLVTTFLAGAPVPGQDGKKPDPADGKQIAYTTVDLGAHPVEMTVNGAALKVRHFTVHGTLGGKGHLGLIWNPGAYSEFGDCRYSFDAIPKAWPVQLKLLPAADPAKRQRQLYEIAGAPIQGVALRLVVPTQAGDCPRLLVLDKNQAIQRVFTLEKVGPAPMNKDLQMTVVPDKAVFIGKEPLTFKVHIKNVSAKPKLLYDVTEPMAFKVEIAGVPKGGPWQPLYQLNHAKAKLPAKTDDSTLLAPGATHTVKIDLRGALFDYRGEQLAKPIPREFLEPGKYKITVRIALTQNPAEATWKQEHSIGEVVSTPAEFTVFPTLAP